jgi:acetyl-CoA synthetase
MTDHLDALLHEKRIFHPPEELVKESNIKKWMDKRNIKSYSELIKKCEEDPEWFWDELAQELDWFKPYTKILEWDPPYAKWFADGKFNIVHNALDRHVKDGEKTR